VVFTNPSEAFFRTLQAVREAPTIREEYSQHEHFGIFSDTEDVHALLEAQKFLQEQLRTVRERLKAVTDDSVQLEDDVVKQIEKQQQQQKLQQQQQQQQQRRASAASLPTAKETSGSSSGAKAAASAANRSRPASSGKQKSGSSKKPKPTKSS